MSFLTPLYIAGALAVTLPVLFHLIQRSPRHEVPFSSLMFLSPSPPRITRRSRLEHLLLLTLRGLALILLALAFARPFLRQQVPADGLDDRAGRLVSILVDTSASMQRGDLWQQAVAAIDQTVEECRPQDRMQLFAFSDKLIQVAGQAELAQVDPARRRAFVAERVKDLRPTWAGTHLGQALVDVLALQSETALEPGTQADIPRRIVLVSDMQSGSRLSVLGDVPWPVNVELELKPVTAPTGNAGVSRLADLTPSEIRDGESRDAAVLRIRVANSSDSSRDQFELRWEDDSGNSTEIAEEVYVPSGESRVVRLPYSHEALKRRRLVLSGDGYDFDNTLYCVAKERPALNVVYLGADNGSDVEGLRYYLEQALLANEERDISIVDFEADEAFALEAVPTQPLVVVTTAPTENELRRLKVYVSAGGTVLYVIATAEAGAGLQTLLDLEEITCEDAQVRGYSLLSHIRFDHPLFASMAGAKFNDFTHIRFWNYRRLNEEAFANSAILAEFETGDPAIIETRVGKGRVVVMAAGWHPRDSQLARSWKFPLMVSSLISSGAADAEFRRDYLVNEPVPLPDRSQLSGPVTVIPPEGAEETLKETADVYRGTTQPGIYTLSGAEGPLPFAVNVDPVEHDTSPLPAEAFEQLGCRLPGTADSAQRAVRQRHLQDREQESRQKFWQWLLTAMLVVLIVETWLAGRLSRTVAPMPDPA